MIEITETNWEDHFTNETYSEFKNRIYDNLKAREEYKNDAPVMHGMMAIDCEDKNGEVRLFIECGIEKNALNGLPIDKFIIMFIKLSREKNVPEEIINRHNELMEMKTRDLL